MPTFEWEGRSLSGELKKGTLNAESAKDLRALVRKDGIILTKASEKSEGTRGDLEGELPNEGKEGRRRRLHPSAFHDDYVRAAPRPVPRDPFGPAGELRRLRAITKAMKEKIEGGARFAETLRDYPNCFDELYVSLVVAGEEGGMLDTILVRLSNYIEKTEKLKRKVKSALIYPSAIVVVAIGVVLVLLLFVIPVFEGMFSSFGKALPAPTQIVIGMSKLVKSYIVYLIMATGAGAFLFRRYYKTDNWEANRRQALDEDTGNRDSLAEGLDCPGDEDALHSALERRLHP